MTHAVEQRGTSTRLPVTVPGDERRPLNVAYVTMMFPAPTETFATNDVRLLRSMGLDLSVHSLLRPHPTHHELVRQRELENVPITASSLPSILKGMSHAVTRPRRTLGLLRTIARECWHRPMHVVKSLALVPRALDVYSELEARRPDVVHIYWGHYPSLVGHLVLEHLPETVVTMSLGAYDLEAMYGVAMSVAKRVGMVRTNAAVNVETIRTRYDVPDERIRVIYNGVDFEFVAAADRDGAGTEPHGSKEELRIISAGSLKPHKRMDEVLRVFARVAKRRPDVKLAILGDGPERERLLDLSEELGIADRVDILGHVPHERVHEEMANSDVFLFLSTGRGERLPNVVKEAMVNGCVCVVSDTPGIEELIPDEDHGVVVGRDLDHAADAVSRLLADPARRAEIRRAAEHRIRERFDRQECVKAYIRAWRALLPPRPHPPSEVA